MFMRTRRSGDSQSTVKESLGKLPSSLSSSCDSRITNTSDEDEDEKLEDSWKGEVKKRQQVAYQNGDIILGELFTHIFFMVPTYDTVENRVYEPLTEKCKQEIRANLFSNHFDVSENNNIYYLPADPKISDQWSLMAPGTYSFGNYQDVKLYHEETKDEFWYMPAGVYYSQSFDHQTCPEYFLPEGYVKVGWHTLPDHLLPHLREVVKQNLQEVYLLLINEIDYNKTKDDQGQLISIGGPQYKSDHEGSAPWELDAIPLPAGYFCPIKAVPENPNYKFGLWYQVSEGFWALGDTEAMYREIFDIDWGFKVFFCPGGWFMTNPGSWYKVPAGFLIPADVLSEDQEFSKASLQLNSC
ncbi:uncharacterized protein LOC142351921 isoform X2 [Convolutriloba macropyga]|uniref:uncharacterized protein LOC142351921 isoform X2 n=1 Tax=Convolutriloba macropyga TaxID=536237 RepID=UPI003F525A01